MQKPFYRSRTNKMLAGLCAGTAEYFEIDPTFIRIAVVVISFFTAGIPALILYAILAFVVPEAPDSGTWNSPEN